MSPLPASRPRPGDPARDRRAPARRDRTATAGAAALAATPERRAAPGAPSRRPDLRVVDESRLRSAGRRKRTRALMVVTGVISVVAIFALASFHAMLLSGQSRLDELNREVAAERVEYESLRHRVAELESPGRIVSVAQDRLGMLPPEEVTWLVPTLRPGPDPAAATDPPTRRSGAGAPWAAVKPFLGGKR